MKPKELMVGDWVYDKHYNGDIEPIQIHNIYGTEVNCKTERNRFDVDEIVSGTYMSDLQPIPLTPEILGKNGFDVSDKEVMQYHFEEDGEKYHFSLRQMYNKDGKPHGYSFYAFNVLTLLDYVHQLQHALKLCGINKKIEI